MIRRAVAASLLAGALALPVRADVLLTVKKTAVPNQVQLDWTPGAPPYDVWREAVLADIVALVNPPVATQSATTYLSTDVGPSFFYLVGCSGMPTCPSVETCTNGTDDDGDTVSDCADSDCVTDPACAGGDFDRDGWSNGADCAPLDPTRPRPDLGNCADGVDNDCDGFLDCADPECFSDPACAGLCGNGRIDGAEQCDDGGNTSGDGCSATCTNEVVPACGDGILQAGEQCDMGPANSDTAPGACRTSCTPAGCSDSVVDYALGEECDDGNLTPGDRCDATCRIEAAPTCGDRNLDLALGEECDDGGRLPGDGCSPTCQLELVGALCANGSTDRGEACDDNNVLNGDTCNPTCNLANTTSLFAGSPGMAAMVDGIGTNARFTGQGVMCVDQTAIWMAVGNVIRKIDVATADVATIAGDAVGNTPGYLDDPVGLNARFMGPSAITSDGTTVWIADEGNRRIRAMSATAPHAVTTVAGSGTQAHVDGTGTGASFDGLRGATYFNGLVYVVDPNRATLRSFDPISGAVVTLAGTPGATGTADGLGSAARFISPRYIASDGSGMLYVADTNGFTVRAYNTVTTYVTTIAGNGTTGYVDGIGTAALVHRPRGLTSDGTSIYWCEFNQHTIRQEVLATQSVTTLVGQHCGGGPCTGGYVEGVGTAALLSSPWSCVFHWPSRSLFVFDSGNNVLRRIQ